MKLLYAPRPPPSHRPAQARMPRCDGACVLYGAFRVCMCGFGLGPRSDPYIFAPGQNLISSANQRGSFLNESVRAYSMCCDQLE